MKEREGRKRGRGKKGREERERKGGREGGRQTMCTMNTRKAVRRKKRL